MFSYTNQFNYNEQQINFIKHQLHKEVEQKIKNFEGKTKNFGRSSEKNLKILINGAQRISSFCLWFWTEDRLPPLNLIFNL